MRLYDEGKLEAATQLVLSDIGKEKMEALRQLTAELVARETSNVGRARGDIELTLWCSRLGVGASEHAEPAFPVHVFAANLRVAERQREEQQARGAGRA
jgi:hypothetical protein